MSDLKKMTLTVKNYNLKASGDLDALYNQVRCEDSEGKTFHFNEVVMLGYLKRHGAMVIRRSLGITNTSARKRLCLLRLKRQMARSSMILTICGRLLSRAS